MNNQKQREVARTLASRDQAMAHARGHKDRLDYIIEHGPESNADVALMLMACCIVSGDLKMEDYESRENQ